MEAYYKDLQEERAARICEVQQLPFKQALWRLV